MATRELAVDEAEPTYYTAEMVRALNEAVEGYFPRYECVYGELLVTPSAPIPIHQFVASRLVFRLAEYLERFSLPYAVLFSPSDISWGRDDVTVQPDVFVVPIAHGRAAFNSGAWTDVRHLALAVEVISPSTQRNDRFRKRRLYQNEGVPLYWIVDPKPKFAEAWTPDAHFPVTERERLTWHPAEAPEPLVIPLAELFAEP